MGAKRKSRTETKAVEAKHEARLRRAFPVVGIGASAGGIEAITSLLKALPKLPGMAFVFIIHQDPKYESNLAQILARSTAMPVEVIRSDTAAEPNHLYLPPPGAELSIEGGVLKLHERTSSGTPSVIDNFFVSLAEDQGSRAISVVLSGSASDGTRGTKEIKAEGGITFAQDDSASVKSMPQSATEAGYVDFVLPADKIAAELVRIAHHDYVTEPLQGRFSEQELLKLYTLIHKKYDIDFTHYKPTTIERRIRRRMALRKVSTLREYLPIARDDQHEVEQLYADILIKVTGFFRDAEVFTTLQRDVFPELLRERDNEPIRVWVPGCATGEEAYSIAISLLEVVGEHNFSCPIQIFATDVSDMAIERARVGLYPESISTEVSPERLRRFFGRINGGYRVSKAVRDCCVFARQNVTKDPPFSKLDFISCRNVMIYFGTMLQRKVISIFHYALRPNGFLLLGSSETIGNFGELFGTVDRKHKIYRKKTVAARPPVDFDMAKPSPPPERREAKHEAEAPNAVFREADRVLLNRFSPTGVLINDSLDVVQFRGRTSRYLEPPPGTASFNLLKMAREGLLADLRAAIHTARKKEAPERREGIQIKVNEHAATVNLEVIPFIGTSKERFMLVLFDEPRSSGNPGSATRKSRPETETRQVTRLKRELQATREYLQSIIEEQEAMNEELRSANEEIQSSNEELQSTNEELETAKEELQSSNEELTTMNEELETRNDELAVANNDLLNLFSAVDIPIVMLDAGLRIRRFNAGAQRVLNLIASDVGRPATDLKTTLSIDNLDELIAQVVDTLEVRELQVKDRDGRTQLLRIRPYKTADNKIDGAILVLIDLDVIRKQRPRG